VQVKEEDEGLTCTELAALPVKKATVKALRDYHVTPVGHRRSATRNLFIRGSSAYNSSMKSLSDDERRGILGEVLHDELQAILEYVKDMPVLRQELHQVQADVAELKQDMKVVKAAVTDLSREQHDFDRRLSRLEPA
jgi:hypothetical protein